MTGPYEEFSTSLARGNGSAVHAAAPPTFNASLLADEGAVDSARLLLRAWLEHCRADEWRRDDIAGAVADACADIVDRGQPGTRTGRLGVTADVTDHELHVTVTDTAVERPSTGGPDARHAPATVSALSTAVVVNATKDGTATLLTFHPEPEVPGGPAASS
jgi:anti-sigma regulatory factor (Ser/Thr protein kinase)